MGNHSCFHVLLFVVFSEIDVRLGDAYKPSAVGSCIGKSHDSLVTPDSFLDWRLVDMKAFVLWGESEIVQSVGKVNPIKRTSNVFVFP